MLIVPDFQYLGPGSMLQTEVCLSFSFTRLIINRNPSPGEVRRSKHIMQLTDELAHAHMHLFMHRHM